NQRSAEPDTITEVPARLTRSARSFQASALPIFGAEASTATAPNGPGSRVSSRPTAPPRETPAYQASRPCATSCARSRTASARLATENASKAGPLRPWPGRSQPTTSNGNLAAHRLHTPSTDVQSEAPAMRPSVPCADPASRVAVSPATG